MTQYEPPKDIWRVNSALQVNEPLDGANDPRWVDTYSARGEASLRRIAQVLGVDRATGELQSPPARGYYHFAPHHGRQPTAVAACARLLPLLRPPGEW